MKLKVREGLLGYRKGLTTKQEGDVHLVNRAINAIAAAEALADEAKQPARVLDLRERVSAWTRFSDILTAHDLTGSNNESASATWRRWQASSQGRASCVRVTVDIPRGGVRVRILRRGMLELAG